MDKVIIVASTHWDREWYRTFQDFQIRLCDLMNQLLEQLEQNQDFACYTFDGQSVVLDDYLEIYPENKERIKKLVQEGKLVFGPLYNLPDEFLSGGEALIRNFLIGEKVSGSIGKRLRAGYVPDNFGHISQLPQILQGVGIDNVFFFRGENLEHTGSKEFWWQGADGSKVLAEYMLLGYWSLKSWGRMDKSVLEQFSEAYQNLKKHSRLHVYLMVNGSDHLYQDPEFTENINRVTAAFKNLDIENGSLEDYANITREAAKTAELPVIAGELRDFRYGPDPTAVTSVRSYLKRLLFETLAETERYAEPLAAMTSQLGEKQPYPHGFFTKIWKKILISLGHDAISGCSTDAVIRDVKQYLTHAKEISARISEVSLDKIAVYLKGREAASADRYLALFNPHPFPYTGMAKTTIYLENQQMPGQSFILYDQEEREIPYEILSVHEEIITKEFPYNSKERIRRIGVEILLEAVDVPPLGMGIYKLYQMDCLELRQQELYIRMVNSNRSIENEYYLIKVNEDASIMVYDKKTKIWHGDMHLLVSRGEAGDEYQHVSPLFDRHAFAILDAVSMIENSPLAKRMEIGARISVPKGRTVTSLGQEEAAAVCQVKTTITLYKNVNRIEFHTEIDNPCKDHLLSVKFRANLINAKDYSFTGFDEVYRSNKMHPFRPELKSTQSFLKPMQRYGGVRGENGSLDVMTKGIYEYQTKQIETGIDFYLTLFRSTSYLFHGLPISWQDGQHSTTPIVATEGSQELGRITADYALCLNHQNIQKEAEEYCYPLRGLCLESLDKRFGKGFSFLQVDSPDIRISAVKGNKNGDGMVVRMYYTGDETVSARLKTMLPIKECWLCNMLEEPSEQLFGTACEIEIKAAPKKIITLQIIWR